MLRIPTEYDARELLLSTGVWFRDKGGYFSIKCPYHNEKTPSAALYKDRWLFKCFACNEIRSFTKFYEDLKHKPWNEHGEFSLAQPKRNIDSLPERSREAYEIIEGRVTSVYDNIKALHYCREREISNDFMQYFNFMATDLCKFRPIIDFEGHPLRSALWRDRLLIPIEYQGKPYSIEGRDYTRQQFPKCLYPKGCKTDILFNQDKINLKEALIVCEGLMDIHKIWTHITDNVTCTFGVSLTERQRQFLQSAKNIILFIDDDIAGHNSVNIFEEFMQNDFKVACVNGKDPGAATIQECETAIKNAVLWVNFMLGSIEVFEKPQQVPLSIKR
jgi:DNA primase